MAVVATGFAVGAATLSGIALGTICGAGMSREDRGARREQEREERQLIRREVAAAATAAVAAAQAGLQQRRAPPTAMERASATSMGASMAMQGRHSEQELTAEEVGFEGFTMEEACQHAESAHSKLRERRPHDILEELQRGNARFWTGTAVRPERSAFARRALISKQFPSVAILGCSDSRVPTEIVFDQGLGDIFVVRVAGNALEPSTLASLQYAVHHLKVKVVMVLGHEMCGAVKAAQLSLQALQAEPAELQHVLQSIKMGLDEEILSTVRDHRALDREAVTTNVKRQVQRLTLDDGLMSKVKQREVMMVGAFYEISSGIVDFFYEVSEPEPSSPDQGAELVRSPSHGVKSRFEPEDLQEIVRNPAGGSPIHKSLSKRTNSLTKILSMESPKQNEGQLRQLGVSETGRRNSVF